MRGLHSTSLAHEYKKKVLHEQTVKFYSRHETLLVRNYTVKVIQPADILLVRNQIA